MIEVVGGTKSNAIGHKGKLNLGEKLSFSFKAFVLSSDNHLLLIKTNFRHYCSTMFNLMITCTGSIMGIIKQARNGVNFLIADVFEVLLV